MNPTETSQLVENFEWLKKCLAFRIDRDGTEQEIEAITAGIKAIRDELKNKTIRVCCACGIFLDTVSRKVSTITKGDCDKTHGLCTPCYEQAQREMREGFRLRALTKIDS